MYATPDDRRPVKRRLRLWPKLALLGLVIGGPYWGLRHYERTLWYAPTALLDRTPSSLELPYDDVYLDAADGETIHSWFIPAALGENQATNEVPCLLYLHGRSGNLSDQLPRLKVFHDLGLSVLAIEYRGFGRSSGRPSEAGLQRDTLAGYYYLSRQRQVPAQRLFIYGETIGAALAVDLAAKISAAGLVLETPIASGIDWLRQTQPQIPWDKVAADRYQTLAKIGYVHMPIVMIQNPDDPTVPARHIQRLFEQAVEPKLLLTIRGAPQTALAQSLETSGPKLAAFIRQPEQALHAEATPAAVEHPATQEGQTQQ